MRPTRPITALATDGVLETEIEQMVSSYLLGVCVTYDCGDRVTYWCRKIILSLGLTSKSNTRTIQLHQKGTAFQTQQNIHVKMMWYTVCVSRLLQVQ